MSHGTFTGSLFYEHYKCEKKLRIIKDSFRCDIIPENWVGIIKI